MRRALSLLLALLAGALAVLASVGSFVDDVAHRPETVRGITETVASDPQVRARIPDVVADAVEDAVPDEVPPSLTQLVEDLVRPVAQSVADDPGVVQGWSDTADEARRAWLADLDRARETGESGPGGEITVPFGPVAQSGVAAALGDVEQRLRANEFNLPGQGLAEILLGTDVGDWAADTVIGPLYERAAALRDDTQLNMTVTVDALQGVERTTVATAVAASAHWIWAGVAAAVLLAVCGVWLVLVAQRVRGRASRRYDRGAPAVGESTTSPAGPDAADAPGQNGAPSAGPGSTAAGTAASATGGAPDAAAPSTAGETQAAEHADDIDTWDALTRGEDPTGDA